MAIEFDALYYRFRFIMVDGQLIIGFIYDYRIGETVAEDSIGGIMLGFAFNKAKRMMDVIHG